MKISGFTFVRNAVKFKYPVVESITSILPIVDEFVVSVGNCDDGTLQLIESIHSPKIKIVHSVWDESQREGGRVLAIETDKAFEQISTDSDWAFYLQADEVVHENDLSIVVKAAEQHLNKKEVDGLIFKYNHFYGTYDYIGDSHRWYDYEIRLIRNDKKIHAFRDAQGFRKNGIDKLKVKHANASIYHYGWVRHPHEQLEKTVNFYALWNGADYTPPVINDNENFDYLKDADSLEIFKGSHPAVMQKKIAEKNWQINFEISKKKFPLKKRVLHFLEKLTGKRFFQFSNYKLI